MNKTYQIINLDLSLLNDLTDTQTEERASLQLGGLLYNDLHDHYGGNFIGSLIKGAANLTKGAVVDTAKEAVKKAAEGAVASGKNTLNRGRQMGTNAIGKMRERSRSLSRSLSPKLKEGMTRVKDTVKKGIERGQEMAQQGKQKAKELRQFIGKASDSATSSDEKPDSDQYSEEDQQQLSPRDHNKIARNKKKQLESQTGQNKIPQRFSGKVVDSEEVADLEAATPSDENVGTKSDLESEQNFEENLDSDLKEFPNKQPPQQQQHNKTTHTARSHNNRHKQQVPRQMTVKVNDSGTSSDGEININPKQTNIEKAKNIKNIKEITRSLPNLSPEQINFVLNVINAFPKPNTRS